MTETMPPAEAGIPAYPKNEWAPDDAKNDDHRANADIVEKTLFGRMTERFSLPGGFFSSRPGYPFRQGTMKAPADSSARLLRTAFLSACGAETCRGPFPASIFPHKKSLRLSAGAIGKKGDRDWFPGLLIFPEIFAR
jgi:hypothetical protein